MKLEARIPNEARMPGIGELDHSDFNRHWPKRPLSDSAGFGLRTLRNRGLWLVACSLWLVVAACEVTPSEQFTPELVVHGLVLAGGSGVRANINRTYGIEEPFDSIFPGVSSVIWRGTDTWPLVYDRRDNYTTGQIYPGPAYGDAFGIRVAKDGLDTVYGRTVIPDSFRITFPRLGDTVTMSDSMVWNRSRNCAGYYMSFRSIEQGDTFFFNLAVPNDTSGDNFDSTVFRLRQMVFLYLYKPGRHRLRVFALDTNYFDWVRAGGFGAGTGETIHLSGGLGVFGSAVGESVDVYVRGDTAGHGDRRRQNSAGGMRESEVAESESTRCGRRGTRCVTAGP